MYYPVRPITFPTSTLCKRIHGAENRAKSKQTERNLSDAQESFLADWCLNEEAAGRAPSRRQVQRFAQAILNEAGTKKTVGERYVDRFLRRNPAVKMKNSALLESSRVRGSTREPYEDFYKRLAFQIKDKKVKPANIANLDEHGM